MKNSTLEALAQFSQIEKDLMASVLPGMNKVDGGCAPRDSTIQNILNYSRALSVRKTDSISDIFMVLN